ncbi:MAG: DUF2157 domain-containing protein [Chromatiales bacterium]|nr:DUF2157 domain-containing protein [Chromatiales bacterium]
MTGARATVLRWAKQGRIEAGALPRAVAAAGVIPPRADWRAFLGHLFLWTAVTLIGVGVIFFFAYNWAELGRVARFALVEALIVAALGFVWRLGLARAGGQAALFGAVVLVGALLALVGQTYQTGADTFELFAAWAALILPWVLVANAGVLWLVWLALVNIAIWLYFDVRPGGLAGIVFSPVTVQWLLFALDTVALVAWELIGRIRPGAAGRLGPRVLATASGGFITALALLSVASGSQEARGALPIWAAWLVAAVLVYRRRIPDLYVLAGGVLSVVIIVASAMLRNLGRASGDTFLLTALVVIGLSAGGAVWLKRVAKEQAG